MATRLFTMATAVLVTIVTASALQQAQEVQRVRSVAKNVSRGNVTVTVVHPDVMFNGFEQPFEVTVTSDREIMFRYGNDVREVLGVYVLGPWGPVKPKDEHWMRGESRCGDATPVTISKDKPWKVQFKLSDLFEMPDGHGRKMEEGKYQVNVKFFVRGSEMQRPADAEPVHVTVEPLARFRDTQELLDWHVR